MKKLGMLAAVLVTVLILAGCPQPEPTELRIVHASPDLAPIDICLDVNKFVESLDYATSSLYQIAAPGTRNMRIVNEGADCSSDDAVEESINLARSGDHTVVALDYADNLDAVLLSDNNTEPEEGKARIRFFHALPNDPPVDLRTAEGDMLFEDVDFKESGGYISVDEGAYDLRIRESITGLAPIFGVDNVTFAAGQVYTLYATGDGSNVNRDLFITQDN